MDDGPMVWRRPDSARCSSRQEKHMMVDGGKRVMMCHATSTPTCHVMPTRLKYEDDMSFHIIIHVSCHVDSFHISPEVADGRRSSRLN
jgi:hypothetical protein